MAPRASVEVIIPDHLSTRRTLPDRGARRHDHNGGNMSNVIYLSNLHDPSMDLALAIGDFGGIVIDDNITLNDFSQLMEDVDAEYSGDLVAAIADIKSGSAKFVQIPDAFGEMWTLIRDNKIQT
jgi:hypothetical protein